MAKIIIPNDRTNKQPVRAYCRNPECLESSDQDHFEFTTENSPIECPKCKANQSPMVGLITLTHFLYRSNAGPVVGTGGLRYALACDSKRAYLATVTNHEAASGEFSVVNCPGCITAAIEQKLVPQQGWQLAGIAAAE